MAENPEKTEPAPSPKSIEAETTRFGSIPATSTTFSRVASIL
ncbi:MAG: hypothetical protein U9Q96_01985 [Patescibacteria group bacterium]|nr:hypothetical protein [Patescibacteria group bacterium]